jgi:hypothetical protein
LNFNQNDTKQNGKLLHNSMMPHAYFGSYYGHPQSASYMQPQVPSLYPPYPDSYGNYYIPFYPYYQQSSVPPQHMSFYPTFAKFPQENSSVSFSNQGNLTSTPNGYSNSGSLDKQ